MITSLTKQNILQGIARAPIQLAPTQPRISLPIIRRIRMKMQLGLRFAPVLVQNGLLVDGHHRYVAACISNYQLGQAPGRLGSMPTLFSWEEVEFDTEDWDSAEAVDLINTQAAEWNGMSLEELSKKLKALS